MFTELDRRAVAAAIAAPAHVVTAKGNGHAGTAMALAPLAYVLHQRVLRLDPADPGWRWRDRLVLSAGHASLLLYVQGVLSGTGLEPADLARSRAFGSRTPGHPELGVTPGIDCSTGPLGQGVAAAVGMAIAALRERAVIGAGDPAFDRTVWCIAGDGCLEEGISHEAASLAGTLELENLVLCWDDNRITIDGTTRESVREDVRARFAAYGWRVLECEDAADLDAIERVLLEARERDGRPTLVAFRTTIGAPAPGIEGTPKAHAGGLSEDDLRAVKASLGFAPDASLEELLDPELLAASRRAAKERGRGRREEHEAALAAWRERDPEGAEALDRFLSGEVSAELAALAALPTLERGASVATRSATGEVLAAFCAASPRVWGGSADLAGSTSVAVPGERFERARPDGAFVRFGIREHAMAGVLSGMAIDGPWRPFGSTYLAFSDYMRPALRLAALMRAPLLAVFTHDSVFVGEDGPTHQPVEQLAALRTIPDLDVVRPADAGEARAVWRRILERPDGPTAIVGSRQGLPVLERDADADEGARRGGYVLRRLGPGLDGAGDGAGDELAILASGSEVALALEAAGRLAADGVPVRVVSMPCVEWFEQEDAAYREGVLGGGIPVLAVEAGRRDAWFRWADEVVGIDEFGVSGAGDVVAKHLGLTADAVVEAARGLLGRGSGAAGQTTRGVPLDEVLRHIDLALDGMLATVRELGDELVNVRPDLPGANSPYVLVRHCCGVMEWWGARDLAGRGTDRDRDAEFRSSGDVADLERRVRVAREQLERDLAAFKGAEAALCASERDGEREPERPAVATQGGVLMHIYEELAQHRGHLDLTADLAKAAAG